LTTVYIPSDIVETVVKMCGVVAVYILGLFCFYVSYSEFEDNKAVSIIFGVSGALMFFIATYVVLDLMDVFHIVVEGATFNG